jgi:predicted TIM-barrel fold metal-dependent hydrolase
MPFDEPPIEPDRPIIDAHTHLWDIRATAGYPIEPQRFLLDETLAMIEQSGHNITHTVFVECMAMYRCRGPIELRPVGQTEFANGVAAMSASGIYGSARIAHRIVGHADLCLGERVEPVIAAHRAVAGERFRGVRMHTAFSEAGLFGATDDAARGRLADPQFHAGARVLARMGFSLDVWCLHPQLADVVALADAVPDLLIVVDHLATPERRGAYDGREADAITDWARAIAELARRPIVRMKLGGQGMDPYGPLATRPGNAGSSNLARQWRPMIETCIEHFTPGRCMFESNFPPDQRLATYGVIWNAFKIVADQYSAADKDCLFWRTAAQTYDIDCT